MIVSIAVTFILLDALIVGYRFGFGPLKGLNNNRMSRIPGNAPEYSMSTLTQMENSPLAGKKVLFLGSSVTYGSASMQEGIPEYFSIRLGCEVTKEAVSGTALVDNGSGSYVQRLLNRVDPQENYSLVVVQLSTNDASRKLPLVCAWLAAAEE